MKFYKDLISLDLVLKICSLIVLIFNFKETSLMIFLLTLILTSFMIKKFEKEEGKEGKLFIKHIPRSVVFMFIYTLLYTVW